jgi:two-component system LytT family sensor kinase
MSRSSHDHISDGRAVESAAASPPSRSRDFAVLQAVFWGGFLAVRAVASARYYPEIFWSFMGPRVTAVIAYAALTTLIHLIVSRFKRRRPGQRLVLTLALCAVAIVPMHTLEEALTRAYAADWPSTQFVDYLSQYGWVLLAWAGYHFAQDHAYEMHRQAAALRQAEATAHAAEMKMLRYQLNPHFLFNSLNAISTLVLEGRNKEAEGTLLSLSRFLRHTIDTDPTQLARLGDEAQVQRLYLEMEAVRFSDKLQVWCNVPEALHDCLVPSLLLQPIVENAIKHGVAKAANGARIAITAAQQEKRLVLTVENDGPTFDPNANGGVGLRNTRERLAAIYGDDAALTIGARAEGGTRVVIDMPLQRRR